MINDWSLPYMEMIGGPSNNSRAIFQPTCNPRLFYLTHPLSTICPPCTIRPRPGTVLKVIHYLVLHESRTSGRKTDSYVLVMMCNADSDYSTPIDWLRIYGFSINRRNSFYWHTKHRSDFMILGLKIFLWSFDFYDSCPNCGLWIIIKLCPFVPHPLDPDSRFIDLLT